MQNGRKTGTVKWFSDTKGYGFITDGDGRDYFVHYTSLIYEGGRRRRTLKEGDAVEFSIEATEKGLAARKVRVLSSPERT